MRTTCTAIVGTGGIGTGLFYRLEGNHAIGREESRRAHRLQRRDACKQHIVLHYLATLLRDLGCPVTVTPVGPWATMSTAGRCAGRWLPPA
jgi:hypothetical protein